MDIVECPGKRDVESDSSFEREITFLLEVTDVFEVRLRLGFKSVGIGMCKDVFEVKSVFKSICASAVENTGKIETWRRHQLGFAFHPGRNRLLTLETRTGVEIAAVGAAVEVGTA